MKFRPKSEDTRNFLKLKTGESIAGVFRGDLHEFRMHWAENRGILCPGKEHCDLCKAGDKSKFRFRVNFVVKEGDSYAAKVIEQGWTFYETLRSLNDGDYPLEKFIMKINRQGSGLTTTYSIFPTPNGLITADIEKKLEGVPLNDLGHITESETEPTSLDNPPPHTDTDIQF